MKERIKTALIVLLMLTSLYLLNGIWESGREISDSREENPDFADSDQSVSDVILPSMYLLNFSDKYHTIIYEESRHGLWTSARGLLSYAFSIADLKLQPIEPRLLEKLNARRSIQYEFPNGINTYVLARSLGVRKPNRIAERIPVLNSIHIGLEKGEEVHIIFNVDQQPFEVKFVAEDRIEPLRQRLEYVEMNKSYDFYANQREAFGLNRDWFVPVPYENRMKLVIPEVYVENEIRTMSELERRAMAEKFFKKGIDYIQEIVETNGSTIFRYNQQVLKMNINGMLEFFSPLPQTYKGGNLYESLKVAVHFIQQNSNVQEGVYLSEIKEIRADGSDGYQFRFKYQIRGIPIIFEKEGVVDFIEMTVFNDHIRSYRQYIRKDMKVFTEGLQSKTQMMTSLEVLEKNYEYLLSEYIWKNDIPEDNAGTIRPREIIADIDYVTLSYYDPCLKDREDQLISTWVFYIGDYLYSFDTERGNMIYRGSTRR